MNVTTYDIADRYDYPTSSLSPRPCGCGETHDPTLRHCLDCDRVVRETWGDLCTACTYQRAANQEREDEG